MHINNLTTESQKVLDSKSERIYIETFDSLKGLDKNTLEVVNNKIDMIKAQAENLIARMKRANDALYEENCLLLQKNYTTEFMISGEKIIAKLPALIGNPSEALKLLIKAYSEATMMPIIKKMT
jgi:hypothetical protein